MGLTHIHELLYYGNNNIDSQMDKPIKCRVKEEVLDGKENIQIMSLFDPEKVSILAMRKDVFMDQLLLKKFAKDYQLIIDSLYLDNDQVGMKLQLISIIGITNYQGNELPFLGFTDKVRQIESVFPKVNRFPLEVRFGKVYSFTKYGMHERRADDDCQLCYENANDRGEVLMCCGKTVCFTCIDKFFKDQICPFCKQRRLLGIYVNQQRYAKMIQFDIAYKSNGKIPYPQP